MHDRAEMNWGYVAGYFDGEGHVSCASKKRGGKTTAMIWYNTHMGSLQAIQRFIGCGSILAKKQQSHQNKPCYRLSVSRKAELVRIIDAMLPHLIVKGDEARRLRKHLVDHVNDLRSANNGKLAAIDSETLRRWYHEEGLTCAAIGLRVGVTHGAVVQMLKSRGIPARPRGSIKGHPKSEETKRRISQTKRRAALSSATVTHA